MCGIYFLSLYTILRQNFSQFTRLSCMADCDEQCDDCDVILNVFMRAIHIINLYLSVIRHSIVINLHRSPSYWIWRLLRATWPVLFGYIGLNGSSWPACINQLHECSISLMDGYSRYPWSRPTALEMTCIVQFNSSGINRNWNFITCCQSPQLGCY